MKNPLRDPRDRRLPKIAGPAGLVIFGITGDLARRKLLPAIYDLANRGLLPPSFALTGYGRRDWTLEEFTATVRESGAGVRRTDRAVAEAALSTGERASSLAMMKTTGPSAAPSNVPAEPANESAAPAATPPAADDAMLANVRSAGGFIEWVGLFGRGGITPRPG